MPQTDVQHFLLVSAVFLCAGAVKGVLGMGLPTVAMGCLGLFMPVPQAAALLVLPSLATNVWQGLAGPSTRALVARLWPMLMGIAAGVALLAGFAPPEDSWGRLLLGACLSVYGALGLGGWRPPALPLRAQPAAGALTGVATGVITGLTGVFVLPAVPYLQALQLDRQQLPQALGLSFTASTVALAALLAARGQLDLGGAANSAFALVPALVGMQLGQLLRQDMSEATFRRLFFAGSLLLGLALMFG